MNNFVKRTLTGIVFLAVMVFGIIWDRGLFFALFAIIMYRAMTEFYTISLGPSMKLQKALGILAGLAAFTGVWATECFAKATPTMISIFFGISLLALLLIPVFCIFKASHEDHGNLAYIYAGMLYIALPIALSPKLVMDGEVYDGWMFLSLFILIWVSDIGAYCLGTAFGQKPDSRKLAPSISPKKSWWGFWSAVAFGVGAAIGLHYLTWLPFPLVHCIAVGLIVSVGGVCGDLVESLWKRYFNVKDSGNCIPGHGGMLDRFDSALVAIPLACIYLSIFGLI